MGQHHTEVGMFLSFWKKSDKDKILGLKTIKINGVLFTIKKIDVTDYISGSKVLFSIWEDWSEKKRNDSEMNVNIEKTKSIYRDVFMAGVVKPKLSRTETECENIFVDEIFNDWEMANKLYSEIMEHTIGKKKMKLYTRQKEKLLK